MREMYVWVLCLSSFLWKWIFWNGFCFSCYSMIVLPLCAIIILIVATSYLILYLIFWVYDYSFRDKNINIDTSKVKVPAPNADEVFSACKQQNWSCYGKKVYEPKDSAGLKYFQTNLRIYNPLNIYNRMFIKIYKWDNLQGSSNHMRY